ncbi:MAG TPA: hypothetical protein IAA04_03625 [Candidatus Lachnoclostridium pullistercoris]|uniref:Uncharacterized protein n=1 Tax=Candidatus Lachnoclostridium pullistercoris TaxID=2838632 RepID=A0A9D2PBS7_9FIRM|nr:hypothetical protein [Candidatus Lachnoclostridium pullistercoris]
MERKKPLISQGFFSAGNRNRTGAKVKRKNGEISVFLGFSRFYQLFRAFNFNENSLIFRKNLSFFGAMQHEMQHEFSGRGYPPCRLNSGLKYAILFVWGSGGKPALP